MPGHMVLVTNNPKYLPFYSSVDFIDGSSWDVLVKVRDMVHSGWRLLSHPLCGNFRPYQQPFRSVLMAGCEEKECSVDEYSLSLVEHALSVYRSCQDRLLRRGVLPYETEEDYSVIDFELMKFTLTQYNLSRKKELEFVQP